MKQTSQSCFVLCLVLCCAYADVAVKVFTKYGAIEGQSHTLHNGNQVNSFLGIPFAKPPVGKLRWKAPEDAKPWTEVLKANHLRSACLQRETRVVEMTHTNWTDYSEDCLYLNIYTPKDLSRGPYPVFVSVHGGGFTKGANFQNQGYFLASQDVVVVSPNYRLGALGFASTGDSVSPGNYGLLDQQHALRFVRDNIKAFGGDPNKVTIVGQSAGGVAVGLQTVVPSSQGLFHQAILQSGTDLSFWALQPQEQKPWTYTQELARAMSCEADNSKEMMNCLKKIPGENISQFVPSCTAGYLCREFQPVIDGHFLLDDPFIVRNQSGHVKVPTLTGYMQQDGSFYYRSANGPKDLTNGITYEEFEQGLNETIAYFLSSQGQQIEDVYRALRFYYTPWGQQEDKMANRDALIDAVTDVGYGLPNDLLLRDVSNSAPAFSYIMRYASERRQIPKWMGATHSYDVPYVYGNNYLRRNPTVQYESGFTHDWMEWNEEDDKMADLMMNMWTNFVKYGDPTPSPSSGQHQLKWRPYTPECRSSYIIDTKTSTIKLYHQRAYALFKEYLPHFLSRKRSEPV